MESWQMDHQKIDPQHVVLQETCPRPFILLGKWACKYVASYIEYHNLYIGSLEVPQIFSFSC